MILMISWFAVVEESTSWRTLGTVEMNSWYACHIATTGLWHQQKKYIQRWCEMALSGTDVIW